LLRTETGTSNAYDKLTSEYKQVASANAALSEECNEYLERADPLAYFLKDLHRSHAAGEITGVEELRMLEEFENNNKYGGIESKVEDAEASHDHVKLRTPPCHQHDPMPTSFTTLVCATSLDFL
jgi:hypothetical protein